MFTPLTHDWRTCASPQDLPLPWMDPCAQQHNHHSGIKKGARHRVWSLRVTSVHRSQTNQPFKACNHTIDETEDTHLRQRLGSQILDQILCPCLNSLELWGQIVCVKRIDWEVNVSHYSIIKERAILNSIRTGTASARIGSCLTGAWMCFPTCVFPHLHIKFMPTCLSARSISIPWFQGAAGLAKQSPALPRRLISIFWRRSVRKASAIMRTPS